MLCGALVFVPGVFPLLCLQGSEVCVFGRFVVVVQVKKPRAHIEVCRASPIIPDLYSGQVLQHTLGPVASGVNNSSLIAYLYDVRFKVNVYLTLRKQLVYMCTLVCMWCLDYYIIVFIVLPEAFLPFPSPQPLDCFDSRNMSNVISTPSGLLSQGPAYFQGFLIKCC